MDGFRIEHRPALTYCALPLECKPAALGRSVPAAYRELDLCLAEHGIEERGMALIRYRRAVRDGPIEVEVGWLLHEPMAAEPGRISEELPEGDYAVVEYEGPYSGLAAIGRDATLWASVQEREIATRSSAGADEWESYYELYVTDPIAGSKGPAGVVEVCLLLRD
jgi:hypothetical protein